MTNDAAVRTVLESYLGSLPQAREASHSQPELLTFLGNIEAQTGAVDQDVRLALAGRALAAHVALSGDDLSPDEARQLIDARLSHRRAQVERGGPDTEAVRLGPEQDGFGDFEDRLLQAGEAELADECGLLASVILQFGLRAPMDLTDSMRVAGELRVIAHQAMEILSDSGPFGLRGAPPGAMLDYAVPRARGAAAPDPPTTGTRIDLWGHAFAAILAAHAEWLGASPAVDTAVSRATERIVSSQVLRDPGCFALEEGLEHLTTSVIEAATTWLDELLDPAADDDGETRKHSADALVEAASSCLVGAWTVQAAS